MKWFKRDTSEEEIDGLPAEHRASFEIVAHKNASDQVAKEAREANEAVQKLFKNNGFHVKLYIAAGGRAKKQNKQIKGI